MLSHPSSVLTAVAALLVTCHAVIRCPQIPGLAGAPGLSGAGGVQVQPYMPCLCGAQVGSLEGNDLPFLQGEKGEKDDSAGLLDLKVRMDLAKLKRRVSRLENVLVLKGIISKAGDKIFASNGKTVDFEAVLQSCETAGGTPAAPKNEKENKAVLELTKQYNQYAYLGMKESETVGKFKYLDGTPVNYTNWYPYEPAGRGKEKCVEMYTDGTWNDRACTNYRLTVCEF